MLKETKNKEEEKNTNDIVISTNVLKLIGVIGVFIFFIVFIITSGNGKKKPEIYPIETVEVMGVVNKIENNYSIEVNQKINGKDRTISYYSDGKTPIMLYEDSSSEYEGFISYNNNYYGIKSEIIKVDKLKQIPDFVNDNYSNVELLKKSLNHCAFTSDGKIKLTCIIKLSDYLNEYNQMFNTNYEVVEDEELTWNIICSSREFSRITIDYTNINKIINNKEDNIIYEINFRNINENDFSDIFENYKKYLK